MVKHIHTPGKGYWPAMVRKLSNRVIIRKADREGYLLMKKRVVIHGAYS